MFDKQKQNSSKTDKKTSKQINYDKKSELAYNQTKFYEDVVRDVKADFLERQKNRRPYELAWQLNMNFVMGNQYCTIGARGAIEQEDKYYFWQEKQVYNHIAPIVETRLARLNRVRPKPQARPFSSSDTDVNAAKLATKILDSSYEKLKLGELITQATAWSETCGTSFYKIAWDSDDAVVSVCSPFEIYPDSNVSQGLDDCSSVIHAKVYDVNAVAEKWGVNVKGETLKVFSLSSTQGVGGLGYNSAVPSITQEAKSNQTLVIERYTRPNAEHKNGLLEIVIGDTLVYYGDLPYLLGEEGKRDFPFIRQISTEQAGCFWGGSIVERVIPVQRAYNAVKNRKHEFLNRLSMGVLTVEDGSVDTDNLEEEGLSPGKILVYRQGAVKPQLMESGNVPTDFNQEEDRLLQEFVTVSGVSEFARNSTTPTAITSGVALQLIAEQDDIRLASSIDSVKTCIKKLARYLLRLYKQYVTSKKLMRYDDNKKGVELFYFVGTDIGCDDVTFETENELTDTPATRKTMIFDLLNAGVLYDSNGKLTTAVKSKILSIMGFGNWENAQDIAQLHIARAEKENVNIASASVMDIDDHKLHIEEHTRYVITRFDLEQKAYIDKILDHIKEHKRLLKTQEN